MVGATNARSRLRSVARTVALLLALGVLAFALVAWNFDQPPFDLALLAKLQPGMTREEVADVLGSRGAPIGETEWVYARFGAWPLVHVHFDDAGRFVRAVYDH